MIPFDEIMNKSELINGKFVDVYGVKLSEIDSMKFSKYLSNNPNLPAPNTLQPEERKQLVLGFLRLKSTKVSRP